MINVVVERMASPADLDGVLDIEAASFNNPTTREWYEGELKRPEVCFIYVLRTPDQPVAGFCAFWRVAEQIHINNLAIRPELRGSIDENFGIFQADPPLIASIVAQQRMIRKG